MKKWIDRNHISLILSLIIAGLFILLIYFMFLNVNLILDSLSNLISVLSPFIYGLSIAFLMGPLVAFFEKKVFIGLKWKPKVLRLISIIVTLLITIGVIILFFSFVIPQVVLSIGSISEKLPQYMSEVENLLGSNFATYRETYDWLNIIVDSSEDFLLSLINSLQTYLPYVLDYSIQITKTIFSIIMGLAIAVYILLEKERFALQIKKLMYAIFGQKTGDYLIDLSRLSSNMIHRFILGQSFDSMIVGILCFIGMSFMGLAYPVLISVIFGVMSIIPVFGPFIGAVPGALILILIEPIQALWFVIYIIVLQQFDGNVLGPRILGDSMGLPSLWIMFAIIVGGGYFGVVGMFLGVPIFAVIYIISKKLITQRLDKESIQIKT